MHIYIRGHYIFSLFFYDNTYYFATYYPILFTIYSSIRAVLFMIDVLERITEYRTQKGWSEYQLAEKSGLTQSTISSWYRRNLIPSIPSLNKICRAFGITLSQFFSEEHDTFSLTEVQKQLIQASGHLTPEQLKALVRFLEKL